MYESKKKLSYSSNKEILQRVRVKVVLVINHWTHYELKTRRKVAHNHRGGGAES